ncbi:MAG: NrfD/PsrC family molybdoenzyme membrane anchor subunit, partial [Raoultibacter sp.]
ILSSLSCGFGIVFLGATFVETRQPFIYPLVWLSRFDSILIIAEAICLAAYVGLAQGNEGTALAANALLFGEMSWLFWIGLVASGLTAPLVMERFVTHGNYRTQLLWIAVFLLVGGFILRLCIIGTADYDITQMPELLNGLTLLS